MKDKKNEIEPDGATLAPSAGRASDAEHAEAKTARRDGGRTAVAEILSDAYALVGDTFDPFHTPQVHALLDQLKELGATVVDRRDVERWRVEEAEAEIATAVIRRHPK